MASSDESKIRSLSAVNTIVDAGSSPVAVSPASAILIASCVLLYMAGDLGASVMRSATAAGLAAAGWLAFGHSESHKRSFAVAACVMLLCAASGAVIVSRFFAVPTLPTFIDVTGEIVDVREMGRRLVYTIDTDDYRGRYVLEMRGRDHRFELGDSVIVSGSPEHFSRSDGGGFDELFFWRGKGAIGKIISPRIKKIGRRYSFASYRHMISQRAQEMLPQRTAGYFNAMITGERDRSLSSMHQAAGTSHLLAVSGFHVGIVFAVFWVIFSQTPARAIIISALLWLYVLSAGASASAVRAGLMLQLAIIGKAIGWSGGVFNSACCAGAIMLTANPFLFWDIGWRLSMIAVLTLSAVARLHLPRMPLFLASSLALWITTSSLTADIFGAAPLAGIVLNVIAIPLFSVLYPIALISSLPSMMSVPLLSHIAAVPEALFAMWEHLTTNIIYLMPYAAPGSPILRSAACVSGSFLFASSSGFGAPRAAAIAICMLLICASTLF